MIIINIMVSRTYVFSPFWSKYNNSDSIKILKIVTNYEERVINLNLSDHTAGLIL